MLRPYCGKEMKAGFVQAASIAAYYYTVGHRVIMNGEERL